MAKIAKNETEVASLKESLNLYYLNNTLSEIDKEPISDNVSNTDIKDKNTLETIVKFQYEVASIEEIRYESLYYLDLEKLGVNNIKDKRYFMDIETRIIYINGGILLASGETYVLEEKNILPVQLTSEETDEGFRLIASIDDLKAQRFTFYIDNKVYKTNEENNNISKIEVNDKSFGNYECLVKVYDQNGREYLSSTINVNNYVIREKNDLEKLRNMIEEGNKFEGLKVRLVNDIDLGGSIDNRNWIPIGDENLYFAGILEGNNHKIINLYNKETEKSNQGLFGYLENATIQHLQMNSGNITGTDYIGSVVGKAKKVNILNCTNNVDIVAKNGYVGGIVGFADKEGKIEGCINNSRVSSSEYVNDVKDTFAGGIVGASYTDIRECTNNGNITTVYSATGGIAGESFKEILNCENNGIVQVTGKNINNDSTIGGIVGYIKDGRIEGCSNNQDVIAEGNCVGGTAGISVSSDIVNCNNIAQITANNGYVVGGILGIYDGTQKVIEDCFNSGKIVINGRDMTYGNSLSGGICGQVVQAGLFNNCINTGDIISNGAYVGGICGTTVSSITNSKNSGNITVNKPNSFNNSCVGGIVGQIDAGYGEEEIKIDNCSNTGIVFGNGNYVSGITSVNSGAIVQNSYNTGSINSSQGVVGGIVGDSFLDSNNTKPIIRNCYNTGNINSQGIISGHIDSHVGGIVAGNYGTVNECWNSGKIAGISVIGGICGINYDSISDSYNIGTVQSNGKNVNGDSVVGGIAGTLASGSLTYCYNRGKLITENRVLGGIVGLQRNNSNISYSYNTFYVNEQETKSNIVGYIESGTRNDCYYLSTITSGEQRQENDMKTTEFINLIGGSPKWKLDTNNLNNGFIILNWQ